MMGSKNRLGSAAIFAAASICLVVATTAGAASSVQTRNSQTTTLVVWDLHGGGGPRQELQDRLNQTFMKRNPDIRLRVEHKTLSQVINTAKFAFSGDGAPDVAACGYGWLCDGPLVQAKLIRPLDAYDRKYGWTKGLDPNLINGLRFTSDGKRYGVGKLFGWHTQLAPIGIFYNRSKLAALGLRVPRTFAEFENALAKAKAAGETPLMVSDLDKWPLVHAHYQVAALRQPKKWNDFIFKRPGARFDNPAQVQGFQVIKNWADKGYFPEGFLGIGIDDTIANFRKGTGVFTMTGWWWSTDLSKAMKKNVGFFWLPPAKIGQKHGVIMTFENPYMITTASKNPDAAAKYIDFITGIEAAKRLLVNGTLTIRAVNLKAASKAPKGSLLQDQLQALAQYFRGGVTANYLDQATPTMLNTVDTALQQVVGGKMEPREAVARVQKDQEKFKP
jgi:raffinose/stachyose/melibiose transport system substrate-binding protein